MRILRLLIVTLAILCALALGVFALVSPGQAPADDVIIIKGGSLTVECPPNQDKGCLGIADVTTGKYKHTKDNGHILKIVVKDSYGVTKFSSSFDASHQPQIEVTYK